MKRFITILMALVMLLSLATTAFAQDVDTEKNGHATITINNASNGVTYTVYKVFDATVNSDGTSIAYSKPGFTANEYFDVDASGNISAKDAAYANPESKEDSGLSDGAISWIKENGTKVAEAVSDGSTLNFINLEYGYYYITSTLKNDAAITVTSTKPNANVIDKNTVSPNNPSKKVKNTAGEWVEVTDANIGEEVEFKLELVTTTYVGEKQIKEYVIDDTFPAGLEFVSITSVQVTEPGETAVDATYTDNNGGFPITVSWLNDDGGSLYATNSTLTVIFKAKLNDAAVIDGAGNINTGEFSWNFTDNNPGGKLEDTASVETYAIALKKVSNTGANLAGAKFQLPFYVKSDPDANGAYIYAGTTAGEGLINVITTPESGEITIKGLKSGTHVSITETEAPDGYNKLTSAVEVTPTELNETRTTVTKYLNENGEVIDTITNTEVTYTNNDIAATVVFVVNKAGATLPSTGGMGTTLFYVFGGIMMLAAVVLLVTKKRMANAE